MTEPQKPTRRGDPATKRNLTGEHPERAPHNPRQRKVGEGLTLTKEIQETISAALRVGCPLHTAAAFAGVGHATFDLWLRNGRRGLPPYQPFIEAIDKAVAEAKMRDLVRVDKGADSDWKAAAWKLERRWPDEFGEKKQVNSDVNVQARPFIDTSKLTLDEQRTLLALLRKGTPDQEQLPKDGTPAVLALTAASEAA